MGAILNNMTSQPSKGYFVTVAEYAKLHKINDRTLKSRQLKEEFPDSVGTKKTATRKSLLYRHEDIDLYLFHYPINRHWNGFDDDSEFDIYDLDEGNGDEYDALWTTPPPGECMLKKNVAAFNFLKSKSIMPKLIDASQKRIKNALKDPAYLPIT